MDTKNKTKLLTTLDQLITGIQKRFSSGALIVASQSYTGPQLVAVLQPLADALTAAAAARTAYRQSILSEEKALAQANEFLSHLVAAIYASFGNSAGALADFGLPLRQRRVPTAATKATAAAKAKATREARGEGSKAATATPSATTGSPPAQAPAVPSVTK